MKVYRLVQTGGAWTQRLATGIEQATEGDFLVLPSDDVAELTRNAVKRKGTAGVRVMTYENYQWWQREAGEDLSDLEVCL